MIGRTNGSGNSGGGGGAAALAVVGGTVRPANAAQGTIWVNTSVDITDCVLSAAEPANPVAGMVWITIGDKGSIKAASPVGGDWVVVYPLSAKQRVNGAWVDKEAKSYIGGEWFDLVATLYLYNNGDECVDISGGFKAYAYKPSGAGGTVLAPGQYLDTSGGKIKLTFPSGGYAFSLFNETAFSIDDINQIEVVYSEASASGVTLGVTQTKAQSYSIAAAATPASGAGVATIDVSALTGDYYFVVSMTGSSSAAITISEIRLV